MVRMRTLVRQLPAGCAEVPLVFTGTADAVGGHCPSEDRFFFGLPSHPQSPRSLAIFMVSAFHIDGGIR
jgi:hypothetical protein